MSKTWQLRSPMTVRRTTEITIETEQVLIIRRRRGIRSWCGKCGREVDVVRLQDVASATGRNEPALRDSPVARKWHLRECNDGTTFVCLDSILKMQ
jgi:hypothetical protein